MCITLPNFQYELFLHVKKSLPYECKKELPIIMTKILQICFCMLYNIHHCCYWIIKTRGVSLNV